MATENIQIQLKDYKKEMKYLHVKYILLIFILILSFILINSGDNENKSNTLEEINKNPNLITLKIPVISLINDDDFRNNQYMILNQHQKRIFENIKIAKIEKLTDEQKLVTFTVEKNQGSLFHFLPEEKYYLLEFFQGPTKKIKKGSSNEIVF